MYFLYGKIYILTRMSTSISSKAQLNRALGPMYDELRHKTMMIPGKTKIFQRDLFEKIRFENVKFNFHPLGIAALS